MTVAKWFLDDEPGGNRCNLHHPYNDEPAMLPDGWTACEVNGATYAYHIPCRTAFIVPREHDCPPASPPSPAAAPATVHNGRGSLTVTMRVPESFAQADADVDALFKPTLSQIIRTDVDSLYFHRLRLRVAQDLSLAEHITVLYTDAEGQQHRIGLLFEDELRWPPGFEHELWENENAIGVVRAAASFPSPIAAFASAISGETTVTLQTTTGVALSVEEYNRLQNRAARVRTLQEENEAMREDAKRLRGLLERERSAAVLWIERTRAEIRSRRGMSQSRGSYEWDDDGYRKEFGMALDAIDRALSRAEWETNARSLADCPQTSAEVTAARAALSSKTEPAR